MKYFRSRYTSAVQLLEQYAYPEPFHIAAKNFFKGNKKYGSQDRKAIAEICYTYLRCGLTFEDVSLKEGILLSAVLLPLERVDEWNRVAEDLGLDYSLSEDFFDSEQSFDFIQKATGKAISYYPQGFLMTEFAHYNASGNARFRPKIWAKEHSDKEVRQLGVVGVKELKVNQVLEKTLQIQDLSSQFICHQIAVNEGDKIWDVCCGSGGKSLNLSAQGNGEFCLSDVRPAILQNAKSRFQSMYYDAHYGVADMQTEQEHLTFGALTIQNGYFDTILADVPCSGSGTWFRTPEHFTRFDYRQLETYTTRQIQIVKNALPFLKKGGAFYYITCSIFKEENEVVRDWILQNSALKLVDEIAFDGLRQQADGMYMACFK